MKLALGTAQFGLDYGITNPLGQVPLSEVKQILQLAHHAGIDTLDSALAYGSSQQVLAETGVLEKFALISKVQINHPLSVRAQLLAIQQQTQLRQFAGVLLHDADTQPLRNTLKALEELAALQQEFGIAKIGISTYNPETLFAVLPAAPCSLVQFPANIFDQRFLQASVLELCQGYGVTCHARSLFLQGLLLTEQSALPTQFSKFSGCFEARDVMAARYQIDFATLCLSLIAAAPQIERWIIGTCQSAQLQEMVTKYKQGRSIPDITQLQTAELELIRPDFW